MLKFLNSLLWGSSIALSWTWGLGLFFSIQMSLHFGVAGLLAFMIPNMLGLFLFGYLTNRTANKCETAHRFEKHFFETSHPIRYVFFIYQFAAVALTFFAIFNYLYVPIGVELLLIMVVALGAAMMIGDQLTIGWIKWWHLIVGVFLVAAGLTAYLGFEYLVNARNLEVIGYEAPESPKSLIFWGFIPPIMAGFLLGPWLDLQQWQRAIQIKKEGGSILQSYIYGGTMFFVLLVLHGLFALEVASVAGAANYQSATGSIFHEKGYTVAAIFGLGNDLVFPLWMKIAYGTFLSLAVLTTLDSGYIAFRWFLKHWMSRSENIIMTVIPEAALASPVGPMAAAAGLGAIGVLLNFELEYFMSLYGSFLVGYSLVYLVRSSYVSKFTDMSQVTLLSVGGFSLGLFGIGFFKEYAILMAAGALIPLLHGVLFISSRAVAEDLSKAIKDDDDEDGVAHGGGSVSGMAAEKAVHALEAAIERLDPKTAERFQSVIRKIEPTAAQTLTNVIQAIQPSGTTGSGYQSDEMISAKGHFEGKWFCYTFMTTYFDTNSVGNVYFGMYGIFVGKVREMFFNVCMPKFDLKNTSFYILTRSFEHKFNMESKEFEYITVKIRVSDFNRKFATLEHQIFNAKNQLLGKGKQTLLFVSSKDYSIVDLPNQVKEAFLPHL